MKQTKVFSEEVSMKSRCSWRVGILIGILVATVVGIFCTGIIKITHTKIPFLTGLITQTILFVNTNVVGYKDFIFQSQTTISKTICIS